MFSFAVGRVVFVFGSETGTYACQILIYLLFLFMKTKTVCQVRRSLIEFKNKIIKYIVEINHWQIKFDHHRTVITNKTFATTRQVTKKVELKQFNLVELNVLAITTGLSYYIGLENDIEQFNLICSIQTANKLQWQKKNQCTNWQRNHIFILPDVL